MCGKKVKCTEEWCMCCDECTEKYFKRMEKEFPNYPFNVSLGGEELCLLDEPFTDEKTIIIYDDRMDSYFYNDVDERTKKKYRYKLKVSSINNKPITLRQILKTMAESNHYNDPFVTQDNHHFLEAEDSNLHLRLLFQ